MGSDRWNVDICAAIVAEKPPQLPLREELISLGFEVVLAAAGTGIRASKFESKEAVRQYRKIVAAKDLKKRRFFPKSSKRIRETLAERKRIEHELALPHACSYETYDIKMRSGDESCSTSKSDSPTTTTSESGGISAKKVWGMFQRRRQWRKKIYTSLRSDAYTADRKVNGISVEQLSTRADAFPDYLVPDIADDYNSTNRRHSSTSESSEQAMINGNTLQEQNETWKTTAISHNTSSEYLLEGESPDSTPQQPSKMAQSLGLTPLSTKSAKQTYLTFDSLRPFESAVAHEAFESVAPLESSVAEPPQLAIEGISPDLFETFSSIDEELLLTETNSTGLLDGLEIKYDAPQTKAAENVNQEWTGETRILPQSSNESSSKVAHLADKLSYRYSYDSRYATAVQSDMFPANVWSSDDEEKKDDGIQSFNTPYHIQVPDPLKPHTKVGLINPFVSDVESSQTHQESLRISVAVDTSMTLDTDASVEVVATDQTVHDNSFSTLAIPQDIFDHFKTPIPLQPKVSPPPAEESKSMTAFERATAEILRVTGLEVDSSYVSTQKPSAEKTSTDWIASAKHVFENISSEVLKVAGMERTDQTVLGGHDPTLPKTDKVEAQRNPNGSGDEVSRLYATLVLPDVPPSEIETILAKNPELPQVRRNRDGRLPLHVLCDRRMLDRTSVPIRKLTDYLLDDIANHKLLIRLLLDFYPSACLVLDTRQDLPVHLLARRLMEWEATWYEIVYQRAATEGNTSGDTATAITKLYQTMSESIEMLLQPVVENKERSLMLCRAPGSMGTILPLHIASIFTVSVKLLRQTIEGYPEGATIHCDLGILRTFIPDESLALELHDNLSTDFPKWEGVAHRLMNNGDPEDGDEDSMRRSDLLFAYNPIEPYRLEKSRIRRIESRIQYDATVLVGKTTKKLDRCNERLWIWMCTFRERETDRPTYVNSVKRIVSVLPLQSLRYLISTKTEDGSLLIDAANNECLKVIQRRLEKISSENGEENDEITALQCVETNTKTSLGTDFVARLCRLVFNIPELNCPTSFIILPYKLLRDDNGRFLMSSPKSNMLATKFAECLQNLTEPHAILHLLDFKSRNQYGQSLFDEQPSHEDTHDSKNVRLTVYEDYLTALYQSGDAYLYVIDEKTGLPQVSPSDRKFPMRLTRPEGLIRKLLPLMMMSMVQMRGDKAISKLASVILDELVERAPQGWIEAAKLLTVYVDSIDVANSDLVGVKESLKRFNARFSIMTNILPYPNNGMSEWDAEISILQKLIAMNDPDRSVESHPTETSVVHPPLVSSVQASSPSSAHGTSVSSPLHDKFASTNAGNYDSNKTSFIQPKNESDKKSENAATDSPAVTFQPDVIDLARKMNTLFEMQHRINQDSYQALTEIVSKSVSWGNESDNESTNSDQANEATDVVSRCSIFEDFSEAHGDTNCNSSTESEKNVRVWNSVDRVWEDVTLELQSRAETFCEDYQILHLKVALAEQARKLSELGKRVSLLKDEERRLGEKRVEVYDLTDVQDSDTSFVKGNSLSEARKLVLRMGDLEKRLICDEIQIQHLSMGAFTIEHEGDAMLARLQGPLSPSESSRSEEEIQFDRPPLNPSSLTQKKMSRGLSRISWGSASHLERHSERSFLLYENSESQLPDFRDEMPREKANSGHSIRSSTGLDVPLVVLDELNTSKRWFPVSASSRAMLHPGEKASSDESSVGALYTVWERKQRALPRTAESKGSLEYAEIQSVFPVTPAETQRLNPSTRDVIYPRAEEKAPLHHSPYSVTKSVRFSPAQTNETPRDQDSSYISLSQKLSKAKSVRLDSHLGGIDRLTTSQPVSAQPDQERHGMELQRYDDDFHSPSYLEFSRARAATISPSFEESVGDAVSSVFRPADTVNLGFQSPQRELSALSSDRSHSSDVYNAQKVMDIEELISKYTAHVDTLSGYDDI